MSITMMVSWGGLGLTVLVPFGWLKPSEPDDAPLDPAIIVATAMCWTLSGLIGYSLFLSSGGLSRWPGLAPGLVLGWSTVVLIGLVPINWLRLELLGWLPTGSALSSVLGSLVLLAIAGALGYLLIAKARCLRRIRAEKNREIHAANVGADRDSSQSDPPQGE